MADQSCRGRHLPPEPVRSCFSRVKPETRIEEGEAAEQIVKLAREEAVDLVILSSHGQSGLSGWNVSSVVQKVILRAYTSVMIVRAYQPFDTSLESFRYTTFARPPRRVAAGRGHPATRVCSAGGRRGPRSCWLTWCTGPRCPATLRSQADDAELAEQVVERNRVEAVSYLEDVKARLQVPNVETRLLISDRVASSLHGLAEQEDVDLVLLSAARLCG